MVPEGAAEGVRMAALPDASGMGYEDADAGM
jgi:hypothetical protein